MSEEEQKELQKVSRATSEAHIRHQRARALLVVSAGKSLSEAARLVGWKSHEPMTKVTRRFNTVGLVALDDLPRPGHIEPTDQNNKHAFCKKLVGRQIA